MGINFDHTAPGTPQQNGVVERAFVTVMGKARAMIRIITESQPLLLLRSHLRNLMLLIMHDFDHKTHQLREFEGRDKPLLVVDAQVGDLNQTTTTNDWLK